VEITLEDLGPLFPLSCSRFFPLVSSLCERVWVLDLFGWEDGKGLDTETIIVTFDSKTGPSRIKILD